MMHLTVNVSLNLVCYIIYAATILLRYLIILWAIAESNMCIAQMQFSVNTKYHSVAMDETEQVSG